jgi:cytochrome c peroxidase
MKRLHYVFGAFVVGTLAMVGCQKNESVTQPLASDKPSLPAQEFNYSAVAMPQSFSKLPDKTTADGNKNSVTDAGATLGRVLFYDTKLSINNTVACGSCHHQKDAFADPVGLSEGFEGRKTTRNASALVNSRYQSAYFWDARETKLEEMVLKPVENHIEMGMEDQDKLAVKLARFDYYPALFEKAFGDKNITKERVGKAMAQFLYSMVSYQSKFDKGQATNFQNFTSEEDRGRKLFFERTNCAVCHAGANFSGKDGSDFANIGLNVNYTDKGMPAKTDAKGQKIGGEGVFKVPSLRNVGLTAPYMHDGRFKDLKAVVEHYNSGVADHTNLDTRVTNPFNSNYAWDTSNTFVNTRAQRLNLSEQDKSDLVAFLKTLSDDKFTSDPKFANPFN